MDKRFPEKLKEKRKTKKAEKAGKQRVGRRGSANRAPTVYLCS